MFNVGPEKILLILLIALVLLGPRELPDAARKLGNVLSELRRLSAGFEREFRSAFDDVTSTRSPDHTSDPERDAPTDTPDKRDEAAPAA